MQTTLKQSHQIIKRVIKNIPPHWTAESVETLFRSRSLEFLRVSKSPNKNNCTVAFQSQAQVDRATHVLQHQSGFTLDAPAGQSAGGFGRTRRRVAKVAEIESDVEQWLQSHQQGIADPWYSSRLSDLPPELEHRRLCVDRTAALARLSIENQHLWKSNVIQKQIHFSLDTVSPHLSVEYSPSSASSSLNSSPHSTSSASSSSSSSLNRSSSPSSLNPPRSRKQPYSTEKFNLDLQRMPLLPFVPSPSSFHYRNKAEFTFGLDPSGAPCLGFLLGNHSLGHFAVGDPSACPHIALDALEIARLAQRLLLSPSLPPFDRRSATGFWKALTVRGSLASGDLLVVLTAADALSDPSRVEAAQRSFAAALCDAFGDRLSLLWVSHNGPGSVTPRDCPTRVLLGREHLTERMFGRAFRLSKDAFFQANTAAAEVMFRHASGWLPAPQGGRPTVLLDVCCGLGVAGVMLADAVDRVIAFDIDAQAVQDGRESAAMNGVANIEFHAMPAEEFLPRLVDERRIGEGEHVVAIVDPPRAGMHPAALHALRRSPVRSLVYVSCNMDALLSNDLIPLISSDPALPGKPFTPVHAQGFDLFPHTPHVELAMLLTREA